MHFARQTLLYATLLILYLNSLQAQSTSTAPASLSVNPCDNTISLSVDVLHPSIASVQQVKLSVVNTQGLYFSDTTSTTNLTMDSITVDNDSIHLYMSNLSAGAAVDLLLKTTCEAIAATTQNFNLPIRSLFKYGLGNSDAHLLNVPVTTNSPFLILANPWVAPFGVNAPTVGDTVVRTTIIKNTGTQPYTGSFRFEHRSGPDAQVLGIGVKPGSFLQATVDVNQTDTGEISGTITGFQHNDSLVFYDTTIISSCDVDSTKTDYFFNYGCSTGALCASTNIGNAFYPEVNESGGKPEIFYFSGDTVCYLSGDTLPFLIGITNIGAGPSRNVAIAIGNDPSSGNYSMDLLANTIACTFNGLPVPADSADTVASYCGNFSLKEISYTIPEMHPGDTVWLSYDLFECCEDYRTTIFYPWININSDYWCSENQQFHRSVNKILTFKQSQFFENLNSYVQVPPGDTVSDTTNFCIENTSANFKSSVFFNYDVSLFGDDSAAVIEVEIMMDTGLRYVDNSFFIQSLESSPIDFTWIPFEVTKHLGAHPSPRYNNGGAKDTIKARFALPDNFYHLDTVGNTFFFDTLNLFMSNSKVNFDLQGICPAIPSPELLRQFMYIIPDTNCDDACRLLISAVEEPVTVLCPGCEIPGAITRDFSIQRINIGEQDTNNNHFPDFPNSFVAANSDVANTQRMIHGDTVLISSKSTLWPGSTVTLNSLNFQMRNMIAIYDLSSLQYQILDSITCTFVENAPAGEVVIKLPASYLNVNMTDTTMTLNLHIDSLQAQGWPNAHLLDYYEGYDSVYIDMKARFIYNPTEAQELIYSQIRVFASGVYSTSTCGDADGAYYAEPSQPLLDCHRYWCEFWGTGVSAIRVSNLPSAVLYKKDYNTGAPWRVSSYNTLHVLQPNQGLTIGGTYDDSFPYEVRKFLRFDSVVIEKPEGYKIAFFDILRTMSPHTGSWPSISSKMLPKSPPAMVDGHYHFSPETYVRDTNYLFPIVNSEAVRTDYVYDSDEDEGFKNTYYLTPEICSNVIGDSVKFGFRAYINNVPMSDTTVVVEDSLYAYMPPMVLETERISTDTIYLTDTTAISSLRIRNLVSNQPIYNTQTGQHWDLYQMQNCFAKIETSSRITLTDGVFLPIGNLRLPYTYDNGKKLYELGTVLSTGIASKSFYFEYKYDCPDSINGAVDTITVYTGWNCDGYPDDIAHACQVDTTIFLVYPEAVGLDAVLTTMDSVSLCDTIDYTLELNSQGPGKMLDIEIELGLGNGAFTYVPNSAYADFAASSSNPIALEPDGSNKWQLNDLTYLNNNGFDFADGQLDLHFKLVRVLTQDPQPMTLDILSRTYCGDTIEFHLTKDHPTTQVQSIFEIVSIDSNTNCGDVDTVFIHYAFGSNVSAIDSAKIRVGFVESTLPLWMNTQLDVKDLENGFYDISIPTPIVANDTDTILLRISRLDPICDYPDSMTIATHIYGPDACSNSEYITSDSLFRLHYFYDRFFPNILNCKNEEVAPDSHVVSVTLVNPQAFDVEYQLLAKVGSWSSKRQYVTVAGNSADTNKVLFTTDHFNQSPSGDAGTIYVYSGLCGCIIDSCTFGEACEPLAFDGCGDTLGINENIRIYYPGDALTSTVFELKFTPIDQPAGCAPYEEFIAKVHKGFPFRSLHALMHPAHHISGAPHYGTTYSIQTRRIDTTDTSIWCDAECTIRIQDIPYTSLSLTGAAPKTPPCGDSVQMGDRIYIQGIIYVDRFQYRFINQDTTVDSTYREFIGWTSGTGTAYFTPCTFMPSYPANVSGSPWFGQRYDVVTRSIDGCDTTAWSSDTCEIFIDYPPCGLYYENVATGMSACRDTIEYTNSNRNSILRLMNNAYVCNNTGQQVRIFEVGSGGSLTLVQTLQTSASFLNTANWLNDSTTYKIVIDQKFNGQVIGNCTDTCEITFIDTTNGSSKRGLGSYSTSANQGVRTVITEEPLTISYLTDGSTEIELQEVNVLDITGRVLTNQLNLEISANQVIIYGWETLASGAYLIQTTDQYQHVRTEKITRR